jgi:predicted MFS family arabinose efflux permease
VFGSLLGGWWASRLKARSIDAETAFVFWCTLAAIPFAFLAFWLKVPWQFYACMFVTEFLLFMTQPSINVIIMESVGPLLRSTALAFSVFVIHLCGDLISPPLVGWISDKSSLSMAVLILPAALIPSLVAYGLPLTKTKAAI